MRSFRRSHLSSAVFTRDGERGARFAAKAQAGMTHVNDSPVNDLPNCPFGGEKNSGLGRYNGRGAIEEFTTPHWISVQHAPVQYPF
ncbi:MAG TPA: aldehyde dehydrogenase family protein [Tepidisphaeraceae bacterium]